jgi:CSLREA domain-containing protein
MPNYISKSVRFGVTRKMRRQLSRLATAGMIGLLVSLWSQTAPAATITVTTAADDLTPNNGSVSLREAMTAINAGNNLGDPDITAQNPGTFGTNDTIDFNIPGAGVKTINVGTSASASGLPLPTMTKPRTIDGYSQAGASVNTLANSDNAVILIELNGTGAGSGANGLTLGAGSGGSTIRGLAINRFAGNGIVVQSNGNIISGNFSGTNPTGTTRMPNGTFPNSGDGILIQNASNNVVGTSSPADRNVLSGNALAGVHITGTLSTPATGNKIQGNFVGVAANGISGVGTRTDPAPAPNSTEGNNLFGIEISGGNTNTVGGTVAGERNVVGFNADGITMDNGAQSNTVQGNFVGVGADGTTVAGNLLNGISMRSSNGFSAPLGPAQTNEQGVSFNLIGGTVAGAGNLVEFNGTGGIAVFGNPVSASGQANIGNTILANSIFKNGRNNSSPASLGIDLANQFAYPTDDGVTPNDSKGHGAANDPNNFQNFPVLTGALSSGGTTTITGTLNSTPSTTFRIEFFANDPDPLGVPVEGQQFLGFANVNTDATGNASFSVALNTPVTNGRFVTATATDGIGNTSEFSAGILVPTQPPPSPTPTATATATPTASPTATATATPTAPPTNALNISTRARVDIGDRVTIGGFIISGNAPKKVAVRGLGPSLARFNLSGLLLDPVLELRQADGSLILRTDNWKDNQRVQIEGSIYQPEDDRESVILATLQPAAYTVTLSGKNQTTGIGVVEVYDNDQEADSELANISTRGFVQTGDNVMIGGFMLGFGSSNARIAVRGLGPSLSQFGLSNVLADPTLELHDSNGATLVSNDDWQSDPVSAAQLTANGLALQNPKESGIFTSLPPGAFTAILAGQSGGVGIGVVEIYNLH